MGALDIVILSIFAVFFIIGVIRGFTTQIFSMGLTIGLLVALIFLTGPLANMLYSAGLGPALSSWTGASENTVSWILLPISSSIIFAVISIPANGVRIAYNRRRKRQDREDGVTRPKLHWANRLGGGFFKLIWAFLVVAMLFSVLGFLTNSGLEMFEPITNFMMESNGPIAQFFYNGRWIERIWDFVMRMSGLGGGGDNYVYPTAMYFLTRV